ncbi:hypothetical protein DVH05_002064 [Phytophthora capsici]|nr:hypothetical protein DVH05_002064 [Phytophthora capsici]
MAPTLRSDRQEGNQEETHPTSPQPVAATAACLPPAPEKHSTGAHQYKSPSPGLSAGGNSGDYDYEDAIPPVSAFAEVV